MKYKGLSLGLSYQESLLSRGAWIEIAFTFCLYVSKSGRSSHEERGLKFSGAVFEVYKDGRSSHEERGLKSISQCFPAI